MAKISPSILSLEFFCKNSIYLGVRLHERFVNPQLLKQLAVYKIKDDFTQICLIHFKFMGQKASNKKLKLEHLSKIVLSSS